MDYWGTKYNLINVRKLKSSDPFWKEQDKYLFLTPEVATPAKDFANQPPWEQCAIRAAAVGIAADRLVLAGRSAARLHGISLLGWDDTDVEMLCVGGAKPRGRAFRMAGTTVRSGFLAEEQVADIQGVRMTKIMRTLRDIAAWHGELEGVVAMDAALVKWRQMTPEMLRDALLAGPPYPGKRRVRRAVDLAVENSGSPQESHARYLLLNAGIRELKSLELQAPIVDKNTGALYYVDFLINGWLVLEIDGRVKYDGVTYGSAESMIVAERDREKAIQNTGKVVRRTSDPTEAVALVREALTTAAIAGNAA